MRRVAAVDIGSNTLLFLCAERAGADVVAVADECRFGRLSQGLDKSGELSPEAIERCLDILREFAELAREHHVDTVACVATEAVRKAANARDFTGPAEDILKTPVEVISGPREAALTHRAVCESLPAVSRGEIVIADVGGASTEVIVSRGGEASDVTSLPIGAVRLTERHIHHDPATRAEREAITRDIDAQIASLSLPVGGTLVASAGTATSLAAIELALPNYDPHVVHGLVLAPTQLSTLVDHLFDLSVAEKRALPGLEPARADVVAAGGAIFEGLVAKLRADRCVISDRGVRWGLAYELLARR